MPHPVFGNPMLLHHAAKALTTHNLSFPHRTQQLGFAYDEDTINPTRIYTMSGMHTPHQHVAVHACSFTFAPAARLRLYELGRAIACKAKSHAATTWRSCTASMPLSAATRTHTHDTGACLSHSSYFCTTTDIPNDRLCKVWKRGCTNTAPLPDDSRSRLHAATSGEPGGCH